MYVYGSRICFHDFCYDVATGDIVSHSDIPDDAVYVSADEAQIRRLIKDPLAVCIPEPDPLLALHIMLTCGFRAQYCHTLVTYRGTGPSVGVIGGEVYFGLEKLGISVSDSREAAALYELFRRGYDVRRVLEDPGVLCQ